MLIRIKILLRWRITKSFGTMMGINKIGVFCGSNTGNDSVYAEFAVQLAEVIINAGMSLVYGGANVGLMGVIANHVIKNGGEIIGVIPRSLVDVEIAHQSLTKMYIVDSMHERKALIANLADGFIMLPGGPGSLDEFFEIYTWAQLGFHCKPCGLLNVNNYYDYLLKFLNHAVVEGFLKSIHKDMIIVEHSPHIMLQKFRDYCAPSEAKWIKEY